MERHISYFNCHCFISNPVSKNSVGIISHFVIFSLSVIVSLTAYAEAVIFPEDGH